MVDIVPTNRAKMALRTQLLSVRQQITPKQKSLFDDAIARSVRDLLEEHTGQIVALYSPIRGEPDLMPLADQLLAEGFEVALPIVVAKNEPLQFALYSNVEQLVTSRLGVLEPDENAIHVKPDVLVIPCVGVNGLAYRLGYGGGFYDRTLAHYKQLGHEPMTIGVTYDSGLTEFEPDTFDVPMDVLVTPSSVF